MTALSNPGFPKNNIEQENIPQGTKIIKCKRCNLNQIPGRHTHHCFECDVCVEGRKYL